MARMRSSRVEVGTASLGTDAMKTRHNLYLEREIGDALTAMAAAPGTNKSKIANEAIAAYVARRAQREIDALLKPRFDRLSRNIGHLQRDHGVLIGSA